MTRRLSIFLACVLTFPVGTLIEASTVPLSGRHWSPSLNAMENGHRSSLSSEVTRAVAPTGSGQPALTLSDRVNAVRAIERMYWAHRLWPKENPTPKPALEQVMPDSTLRARAVDALQKSRALEAYWGRPISHDQLQAELNRMAADTHDPQLLEEIFAALHHDPMLIAESLARPALADRLIRSWYDNDRRFHGARRREAESAAARIVTLDDMKSLAPEYSEIEWSRKTSARPAVQDLKGRERVEVDETRWKALLQDLGERFPTTTRTWAQGRSSPTSRMVPRGAAPQQATLIVGRPSALEEVDGAFQINMVLDQSPDSIAVATVRWPKTRFDSWWAEHRPELAPAIETLPGTYTLPRINPVACKRDTWAETGAAPAGRQDHTAVWTGTEMIVWGGQDWPGTFLDDGGRYCPATDTWRPLSKLGAPAIRMRHTAVWTGKEMVVWGGYGYSYGPFGDISAGGLSTGGRYNPFTDEWSPVTDLGAPLPRSDHTAVWTGAEMIVWGGDLGGFTPTSTGGRYDPSADRWVPITDGGAPSAREYHTATWTGSEMIVWGGFFPGAFPTDGARYDPRTDHWKSMSVDGAPSPRYWHSAVWTGQEMIVWGGRFNFGLYTGARYAPDTDTWLPMTTENTEWGRYGHTAVWTGQQMIVFGGVWSPFELITPHLAAVGKSYDPVKDSWSDVAEAPEPRLGHTAIWTGSEMIVWGGANAPEGWDARRAIHAGGRYSPSLGNWIATSGSSAPTRRERHTAVWTGTEMIVYGGADYFLPRLNTGGRYLPSSDTWSSLTGPVERVDHTAVWTGTDMIVFGGNRNPGLARGNRYSPVTDSWYDLPAEGSPSNRVAHCAAWTGRAMLIWGGYELGTAQVVNSGAQFLPETSSWVEMPQADAPAPRYFSFASWTGAELLIWGGFDNSGPLVSGGRYSPQSDAWGAVSPGGAPDPDTVLGYVWDGSHLLALEGRGADEQGPLTAGAMYTPATDTWAPLPSGNSIASRFGATTVWSGRDAVLFGGQSGDAVLGDGARFRPTAETWRPISAAGQPDARIGHSAVWTGNEMLVYGGRGRAGNFLESLGRYCDPPNVAPIANAGHSQVLECQGNRQAMAVLDGSGSTDDDSTPGTNDDIATYSWTENSQPIASSVTASAPFGLGPHDVTLAVTDLGGLSSSAEVAVVVRDSVAPPGGIVFPEQGQCFGPSALPVVVSDTFSDVCDPSIAREYTPVGGPGYDQHGDYTVQVLARDEAGNAASDSRSFTIDTKPPVVQLLSPSDRARLIPSTVPLALVFRSGDDDGASGGVMREVLKLDGCTILDGLTVGNRDGLLSDERIVLDQVTLCRAASTCGFTVLNQPEIRVEATDCGGNVGTASRHLAGTLALRPGICGH